MINHNLIRVATNAIAHAINDHRAECNNERCQEVPRILAHLAHSIMADRDDIRAFPSMVLRADMECNAADYDCYIHAVDPSATTANAARMLEFVGWKMRGAQLSQDFRDHVAAICLHMLGVDGDRMTSREFAAKREKIEAACEGCEACRHKSRHARGQ